MGITTKDYDSDFVYERHAAWHMLLRREHAALLRPALLETEYGEALPVAGGRGAVRTFPLGNAQAQAQAQAPIRDHAVLRYYRRGGVMRALLHDCYIGVNRPLREFRAHYQAEQLGLPVPRLLGVRWAVQFGVIYQHGALVTRLLPEARSLDAVLRDKPDDAAQLASRAGAIIRQMHDRGLWHADLNVHNIVFSGNDVYLLDFDNARLRHTLSTTARARNLLRLLRSLRKTGVPESCFDALLQGYGKFHVPAWLRRVYHWKWTLRDMW